MPALPEIKDSLHGGKSGYMSRLGGWEGAQRPQPNVTKIQSSQDFGCHSAEQLLHPRISKSKTSELHCLGTFCTTFFYLFFFLLCAPR